MNVWELEVMWQKRKTSWSFSTVEKQKGGGCRQVKGERCMCEFCYWRKGWILEIILVLPSHCCRIKVTQMNILKYKFFLSNWCVRLLGNFYWCISHSCNFLCFDLVNLISIMTVFLSSHKVMFCFLTAVDHYYSPVNFLSLLERWILVRMKKKKIHIFNLFYISLKVTYVNKKLNWSEILWEVEKSGWMVQSNWSRVTQPLPIERQCQEMKEKYGKLLLGGFCLYFIVHIWALGFVWSGKTSYY